MPNLYPNIKIWLDGRNVGRLNGTGVYHYALNHYKAICELGFQSSWLLEDMRTGHSSNRLLRLLKSLLSISPSIDNFSHPEWGKVFFAHDLYRTAHVHYRIHKKVLKIFPSSPPNIMHWTYPLPILMEGCQNIVTIHDLIPITHPELTRINPNRFAQLLINLSKSSVHFVTVSETVRQQMINLLNIQEDRITTLYQPVHFSDHIKKNIETAPRIAPPDSFVFYGRIEHRKNIERILMAHTLSKTKTPLVIIGPPGEDQPDFTPYFNNNLVIRLPWSNRLSLLRTLKEAKALIFPSLAEGFGLPIIEAMSLGIPVLTSRGGATEEIAGQSALLCIPTDTLDIKEKLIKLDKLSSHERNILTNTGIERAQFFSEEAYRKRLSLFIRNLYKPC